jgi:hypothetical protein
VCLGPANVGPKHIPGAHDLLCPMSRRFGNVWAVFGSVDIIVRPDVEVELSGTSIMGSKDVKGMSTDRSDSRDRISVTAFSLFGSVTVNRKD